MFRYLWIGSIFALLILSPVTSLSLALHPEPPTIDRNVVLPPSWAFGVVYGAYTNQEQSKSLIKEIIQRDYPIDGFWIDSWIWDWKNQGKGPQKYMDFVADTESYPDMKGLWTFMEKENIKSGMWVWDAIFKTGNEQAFEDFKSRGFFSREYFRTDSWHNGSRTTIIGDNSKPVTGTVCGDINFKDPEAVRYFKQRMKHFFDKGLDFIKLDKTDEIHVCKAMFEMTQELGKESKGRGFILSHSHGVNSEEYKQYPGKWTDDTRSDWTVRSPSREFSPWLPQVAFKENLEMYTDMNRHFYKIPFLANDMGGFAVSTDKFVDEELYIRWLQFAMFVPLTTPFSQPENPTGNIAFKVSERADQIFRKFAHMKMTLFPYIYTYAHRSRLDGVNTIRPFPDNKYQYLFGDEILVSPINEKGATKTDVELPVGNAWIDYWTGERFEGGRIVSASAPLDRIPVFIREGAIIPQRKYARSIERGTNDTLELHVYAGADGKFELIEDDGQSKDYLAGKYAKTEIIQINSQSSVQIEAKAASGTFTRMPRQRRWEVIIHDRVPVKAVRLNGKRVKFKPTGSGAVVSGFVSDRSKGWNMRIEN